MSLPRWQKSAILPIILLVALLMLAGCAGNDNNSSHSSSTPTRVIPTPTPTPGQGQQLLSRMSETMNAARSLHALLNLDITSSTVNGIVESEIWNVAPSKSRVEVHQSTLAQVTSGGVTVSDGKQLWQYDPTKNVVYNGPISANTGTSSGLSGIGGGQNQSLLNTVQAIFTQSSGTLRSSTTINDHSVYDVHVVPEPNSAAATSFTYSGEIYIDKTTRLPVQMVLNVQGIGKMQLDFPTFELNPVLPDSTFTFTPPDGAKVLPLQQQPTPVAGSGTLNLVQAEAQAGYHLFSIPGDQAAYALQGVTALGSPGAQTYVLNYTQGNLSFTISEGKPLANLPAGSGQSVHVRNITATITGSNSNKALVWTEKGIGIRITGALSNDQLTAIAKLLT